jgi:uncharacterized protein YdgA (DUF945 family)
MSQQTRSFLRAPWRWLLAALALLLLAGPLALGGHAQQTYQNLLGGALETLPGGWVIFEHYDRGWFSSNASAELAFQPGDSDLSRPPMQFRLTSRIDHGPLHWLTPRIPPVLTRVETRIASISLATALPPLEIDTDVALNGAVRSRFHLPAADQTASTSAYRLVNASLDGTLELTPGGAEIRAEIRLPSLELLTPKGAAATLSGVRISADLHRMAGGLYSGNAGLTLDAASLGPGTSGLDDLQVTLRQTDTPAATGGTAGDRLSLQFDLSAAGFTLAGQPYGPSELRLSARGWDAQVLAELAEGLQALASGSVAGPLRGMFAAALLARLLPRFAASEPNLRLDTLRIESDQGRIEARAALGVAGLTQDGTDRGPPVDDPIRLLSRLTGDAEIALPRAIALEWLARAGRQGAGQSPEERVGQWIDGGWVSSREGRLASAVRLADGLLTVNGRTFPLIRPASPGQL